MDFHPKEILVTAVYLACKVEEFNVSMQQFIANVQGNQERATKIILNNELLLMQELQFHLTIHNPFRWYKKCNQELVLSLERLLILKIDFGAISLKIRVKCGV